MLNIASSGQKRRPLQAGGLSTPLGLVFIAEESGFVGSSLSKTIFSEF